MPVLTCIVILHALMLLALLRGNIGKSAPGLREAMQLTWVLPRVYAPPATSTRPQARQMRVPASLAAKPASTAAAPAAVAIPVAPAPADTDPDALAEANARLDVGALRRAARAVQLSDRATDQLRLKPAGSIESEQEKMAKKIAQAARPDCLTSFQGMGVLAAVAIPLAAVLDKKDSGCKF